MFKNYKKMGGGVMMLFFMLFGTLAIGQTNPTDPALDFNVFLENNATLVFNESEGPIAMGGNLTVNGNYQVNIHNRGTFSVGGVKVGLLVDGKINYSNGELKVSNNNHVKIGNSSGSTVHYVDNNNASGPIRITRSGQDYNSMPRIQMQSSAPTLGISATNNPVIQGGLIDFAGAFAQMRATSLSLSGCASNITPTDMSDNPLTDPSGQVKLNLNNGYNHLTLTGAQLNNISELHIQSPSASKILVINVNAPGTFNWSNYNQPGLNDSDGAYILYNFYNTTQLNLGNGDIIRGTLFAPFADINTTGRGQNVNAGQIIAKSLIHNGGEIHYAKFAATLPSCGTPPTPPTADFSVNNLNQCLDGNSFKFTNSSSSTGSASYSWNFGDGTTSTQKNPTKTYASSGTYNVTLTVTDSNGSDTKTTQVKVYPKVNATVSQTTVSSVPGSVTKEFTLTNAGSFASYSWKLVQTGQTYSGNPIQIPFSTPGTYTLRVSTIDTNGCSNVTNVTVNILAGDIPNPPTANFSVNNDKQCLAGNSFKFTSTSTGATTYAWDFGDGTTSTQKNPIKNYTASGTYTVSLTATNADGSDSKTMSVTVWPEIDAVVSQATVSSAPGSVTKEFTLTNASSFTSYTWKLVQTGQTYSGNPIQIPFSTPGTYTLRVSTVDTNGCSNVTNVTVNILAGDIPNPPTAGITLVSDVEQCLVGNEFKFTSTSSGATTYAWDFGDGTTSTQKKPTKTYTAAGTYTVSLTATNADGSDTTTMSVTVWPENDAVVSQTTVSSVPGSVTKEFTLTNAGSFASYTWKLLESGQTYSGNPIQIPFSTPGTYTLRISTVDTNGCSNVTNVTVNILAGDIPNPPTAGITLVSDVEQCLVGNEFKFNSTSSGATTYAWDFGDGTTSTQKKPTKTYTASGTYTVSLTATNADGSDTTTIDVTVNEATVADVSYTTINYTLNTVTKEFTLNNAADFTSYSWELVGMGTYSGNPIQIEFTQVGTYTLKVYSEDSNGCDTVTEIQVVIAESDFPTTADFTINQERQCVDNNLFEFVNTTPESSTATYLWEFFDLDDVTLITTSTAKNPPSISYTVAGMYRVLLTVTDNGMTTDRTGYLYVLEEVEPLVDITVTAVTETSTTKIFTVTNDNWFDSISWEVVETGQIGQSENFQVTFTAPGTYTIELTTDNGCVRTKEIIVVIEEDDFVPTADFTVNADEQCLDSNSFEFTSTSTGATSYSWSFGDGTTSTDQNPIHSYADAGLYEVKLIVTNDHGSSEITMDVTVHAETEAVVSETTTAIPGGYTKEFTIDNVGDFTTYTWMFDGATHTDVNPLSIDFTQIGSFDLELTAENGDGCTSTKIINIQITTLPPTPDFAVNNAEQCLDGNEFVFTNQSATSAPDTVYHWDFGDGITTADENPTHSYLISGTYSVLLTVTENSYSFTHQMDVTVFSEVADAVVSQTTVNDGPGFITKQYTLDNAADFSSYTWVLDGTTTYTDSSIEITFTQGGTYELVLTTLDVNGCDKVTVLTIEIDPNDIPPLPMIPDFTLNGDIVQCLFGNSYEFVNTSIGAVSYLWDFGDGVTSTDENPTHSYANPGDYTVTLTAEDENGMTLTKTMDVKVLASTPAIVMVSNHSTGDGWVKKQFTFVNSHDFADFVWVLPGSPQEVHPNESIIVVQFWEAGIFEVLVKTTEIADGCVNYTAVPVIIESDEVSTGNDGGIESYSLGDAVSKLYLSRKKRSIPTNFDVSQAIKFNKSELIHSAPIASRGGEQTLLEMFPVELIPGDDARITSPTDILDYTTAEEVLSVDFLFGGKNKGVVLGIRTADKVYNHTKASCDRLKGAEILKIMPVEIQGHNFLMQALKQRDGIVEYAISFAIGKNAGSHEYSLQSNWFVNAYTPADNVYNFQVWTTNPGNTEKLVNDILNNLNDFAPVYQTEVHKMPESYAAKVTREGTDLVLKLRSVDKNQPVDIVMEINHSETNGYANRTYTVDSEFEQTLNINIDDSYELDGLIYRNGEIEDAFYHADGNWGMDYDSNYTTVEYYRVDNNFDRIYNEDELAVNRNVHIQVHSEYDYLTLYKSLLPGGLADDYTDYGFISFTATGSGWLDVGLVKSSIENWNEQYKITIDVREDEQTYYIPYDYFKSSGSNSKMIADDLTMLTFTFLPVEAGTNNLDLVISDVKFTKTAPRGFEDLLVILDNEFITYPNPTRGMVNCILYNDVTEDATLNLYDISGRLVYSQPVHLFKGRNELNFNINVPSGIYLFNISNSRTDFGTSKVVFE